MQQRIKHATGEIEVTMPPGYLPLSLRMERVNGRGLSVVLKDVMGDHLLVGMARNDKEEQELMERLDRRCVELYDRAVIQPIPGAVSIE